MGAKSLCGAQRCSEIAAAEDPVLHARTHLFFNATFESQLFVASSALSICSLDFCIASLSDSVAGFPNVKLLSFCSGASLEASIASHAPSFLQGQSSSSLSL